MFSDSFTNPLTTMFRSTSYLTATALFVLMWLDCQQADAKPSFDVSKDTTYITEPLRDDGLPNYEQWMLNKYRDGVDRENNAGVLLYQAIWPGELEPADYQLVTSELGLAEIPAAEDALQDLRSEALRAKVRAWLADRGIHVDQITVDDGYVDDVICATTDSAWTAGDLPPLADWLDANRHPLDLVVAASRRSHYYLPSPSLLNDKHEMLIEMRLPGAQGVRAVTQALSIRAMNHLGEGRLDDAWDDALALHRLACLASQAHALAEKLIAIAMHDIANKATLSILSSERLSLDLARQIQSDLAQLDRRVDLHGTLIATERISTIDSLVHCSIHGFGALAGDASSDPAGDNSKVDFNIVLAHINHWYDRLQQAIEVEDYAERERAIEKYESDLDQDGVNARHPITRIKCFFSTDVRSKAIGSIFANLMLPAVAAAISAEERNETLNQLVDIAAVLAIYRADHGKYPSSLAALTPELLPVAPTDPIRTLKYVYKPDEDGYLLYSLGPNGIDDGGSNEMQSTLAGVKVDEVGPDARPDHLDEIPEGADDLSARLPRPPFKLPEPPTPPGAE